MSEHVSLSLRVSRAKPGSIVKDPAKVRARIIRLLQDETVETIEGPVIKMFMESILVHSDTPGAVSLGNAIRAAVL